MRDDRLWWLRAWQSVGFGGQQEASNVQLIGCSMCHRVPLCLSSPSALPLAFQILLCHLPLLMSHCVLFLVFSSAYLYVDTFHPPPVSFVVPSPPVHVLGALFC